NDFKKKQRELYLTFSKTGVPVPVNSNFNGLAIYRYSCITSGVEYDSAPCAFEGVASYCEHVVFNRLLMERGFTQLYLDPHLEVIYEKPNRWKHSRNYV